MKKLAILGFALLVSMGLASATFAATASDTLRIYVTVVEAGHAIQLLFGPDYFFGTMAVSSSAINGAGGAEVRIFRNVGSLQSDFALAMGPWQDNTNANWATQWTYLTTSPAVPTGVNEVRIGALWQLAVPVIGDFGAEDTVSLAQVTSTTSVYGGTAPEGEKGYAVPVLGECHLNLLLMTPATGSANLQAESRATLTVTAL